jgi:single-strand DNA-binding protein
MNFAMNSIQIMGRLTRDPELTYFESKGTQIAACKFSVAVDRKFAKKLSDGSYQRETDFFTVKLFRRDAENAAKHLKKGSQVIIAGGELNINTIVQTDGNKKQFVEIVGGDLILPASAKNGTTTQQDSAPDGFGADMSTEDFPF